MHKWINVDDIIAEQKKWCFLCEGEEETTHCSVCFAKDVVSAIIYHTQGIDLVHCEECRYVGTDATCYLVCDREGMGLKPFHVYPDDFCSYGERKESK